MRHNYPLTPEVSPCRLGVMLISRSGWKKPGQLLPTWGGPERERFSFLDYFFHQHWNWLQKISDQVIIGMCSLIFQVGKSLSFWGSILNCHLLQVVHFFLRTKYDRNSFVLEVEIVDLMKFGLITMIFWRHIILWADNGCVSNIKTSLGFPFSVFFCDNVDSL